MVNWFFSVSVAYLRNLTSEETKGRIIITTENFASSVVSVHAMILLLFLFEKNKEIYFSFILRSVYLQFFFNLQ